MTMVNAAGVFLYCKYTGASLKKFEYHEKIQFFPLSSKSETCSRLFCFLRLDDTVIPWSGNQLLVDFVLWACARKRKSA